MSEVGGKAAGEQPKKQKSGCGGCAAWVLGFVVVMMLAIIAGCVSNAVKPKDDAPTAKPTVTVDSATVSMVTSECEDHIRAVADSSKRHFSGVQYKPYDVVSVDFTGEVKQVDLPRHQVAWEVPVRMVTRSADGSTSTSTDTCRYRDLQKDAHLLSE